MNQDIKNKKILFIHHGKVLGGAPVSLLNTIKGLEKLGCKNMKILFAHKDMKPFFKQNCQAGSGDLYNPCLYLGRVLIGWAKLTPKKIFLLIRETILLPFSVYRQYRIFKKEDPAIIHLNSSILFSSAIAAKISGCIVVWHIREILLEKRFAFRKKFAGWLIRKLADKVIAISYAEAKSVGSREGDNVEVVFNFLDFTKFDYKKFNQEEEKRKLGFKDEDKIVLCLSNLSPRKGTLEIIQSLNYLKENIYILLVGISREDLKKKSSPGSYSHQVFKSLCETEEKKVIFYGFQEEIIKYIAACDLLIAPWTSPHFARPVFEAWAMKKGVIAFDIPGISENIDNGKNGVLVKDRSGKSLAEAINNIIFSSDKLNKMGEEGYKKADKFFRQEVNVKKIYNLYKDLLG